MIKFLGPRSKTDKSVGMYASAASGASSANTASGSAPSGNAKPLSPDAVVEYADIMMDRLPIEESTIDALNTGGHNEVGDDWKKIKL